MYYISVLVLITQLIQTEGGESMGVISIDLRKRQLIYEQIVESVKEQIGRGVLLENSYMPSVRALANELGINPNTIQKAYTELERQGVIQSVSGRGSIIVANAETVRGMRHEQITAAIHKVAAEAAEAGFDYENFCREAGAAFGIGDDGKEKS